MAVPDWSQLGTLSYYFLLVFRQLAIFSVPAFFFITGYFISYSALDKFHQTRWTFVWKRLKTLLIPYLIWSIILILGDILQNNYSSVLEYLKLIVTTGIIGPYWFVPALCYCYILSPIIILLVKRNWKLVLAAAGLIQLVPIIIGWLEYARINIPLMDITTSFFHSWSPLQWIFFFTFGISSGFHIQKFTQWVMKYRRVFFLLTVLSGILNIIESDFLYRSDLHIPSAINGTITYTIYVTAFILWFLSLKDIPFSRSLSQLGVKSYGIYLLHYTIIEFVARLIHKFLPQLLAYQVVFSPLLVIFGLGVPFLIMTTFLRTRFRQYYKYLFG